MSDQTSSTSGGQPCPPQKNPDGVHTRPWIVFELPIPSRALYNLSPPELAEVGMVELEYSRDLAALLANSLTKVMEIVRED